jgi:diacylglycerol kinase family enzyme
MHFRVFTRIPVTSLVANVGPIFRGDFRHPGLLDFEVQEVEISADRPVPFQSGGDAGGDRDRVRMGMAPRSVALLDYTAPGSLAA